MTPPPANPSQEFIRFAVETGVLKFGEFRTKVGRCSRTSSTPDCSATAFSRSAGRFLCARLLAGREAESGRRFDLLYGPAYKGIALAFVDRVDARPARSACALCLQPQGSQGSRRRRGPGRGADAGAGRDRRRRDQRGDLGARVGGPDHRGRRDPFAVLIALDRQERGGDAVLVAGNSAVQQVQDRYGLPVYAIATLDDLLAFLDKLAPSDESHTAHRIRIADYRRRFGT